MLVLTRWPSVLSRLRTEYRHNYGNAWKVKGRFCDPQGAGERIVFANHGLPSAWPIKTRNKIRFIETVQNIVIDDKFAVDVDQAPVFCEEVESWQKDPKTGKELDKFNHAMAAWRYGIANADVLEGKRREQMDRDRQGQEGPAVRNAVTEACRFASHADDR